LQIATAAVAVVAEEFESLLATTENTADVKPSDLVELKMPLPASSNPLGIDQDSEEYPEPEKVTSMVPPFSTAKLELSYPICKDTEGTDWSIGICPDVARWPYVPKLFLAVARMELLPETEEQINDPEATPPTAGTLTCPLLAP
jgi:hypothetical protein